MEKGSYHTLKSITLELGVLEIRHLRCDGVHVCGVVVIDTSESKKKSKLLKIYLLLKLNYRWKSTSYFSKEDKSKKVGHAEIRAVCPATVTVEIFGTNPRQLSEETHVSCEAQGWECSPQQWQIQSCKDNHSAVLWSRTLATHARHVVIK